MSKLMINDLALGREMDRASMRDVRGGMLGLHLYPMPYFHASSYAVDFAAAQNISQAQLVNTTNGNNVAFSHGIHSTVKPKQTASNSIGGLPF